VSIGQFPRDREPQASAVGPAGDERFEQVIGHVGGHARTGILNCQR
jgi:hypothetical protein